MADAIKLAHAVLYALWAEDIVILSRAGYPRALAKDLTPAAESLIVPPSPSLRSGRQGEHDGQARRLLRLAQLALDLFGLQATLKSIIAGCGLDADAVMKAGEAPEMAAKRDAYTKHAIDQGVFGAPFFVIDGERFWGQDRLDFVDRKLAA
jgi:2-hydroxychromene-2-carboxylate isomerase